MAYILKCETNPLVDHNHSQSPFANRHLHLHLHRADSAAGSIALSVSTTTAAAETTASHGSGAPDMLHSSCGLEGQLVQIHHSTTHGIQTAPLLS